MAEPKDYRPLAEEFLDLWAQNLISGQAGKVDPTTRGPGPVPPDADAFSAALAEIFASAGTPPFGGAPFSGRVMPTENPAKTNAGGVNTNGQVDGDGYTDHPRERATPAAPASVDIGDSRDELLRRVAVLEKRLAALEPQLRNEGPAIDPAVGPVGSKPTDRS